MSFSHTIYNGHQYFCGNTLHSNKTKKKNSYLPFPVFHLFSRHNIWAKLYAKFELRYNYKNSFILMSVVKKKVITANHETSWKKKSGEVFLMGITKPCTHLHPAPSTSKLRYLSLHPSLCNTLNNIRTKILHVIGQFSQI